ncbi:MAG: hypothetical protein ISS28_05945 [Candidatus Cloacimonetes bacterium]|nr:hypothetical protein [Candidatus Cloacimonadota bacterium]MBL7086622.1 hypothetical protein [Candidatus Cloacimonadota bacterium]
MKITIDNLKFYYIETLGCPKNLVYSKRIVEFFFNQYHRIDKSSLAEIIIFNTYSFIQPYYENTTNNFSKSS